MIAQLDKELAGLLDNVGRLVGIIEFEHSVPVELADMMSENGRASVRLAASDEFSAKPVAVE